MSYSNHPLKAKITCTSEENLALAPLAQAYLAKRSLGTSTAEEEKAFLRMVQGNMRVVMAHAKRYSGYGDARYEEVVDMSIDGLMTAIEKFDPAKGANFMKLALSWMKSRTGKRKVVRDNGQAYCSLDTDDEQTRSLARNCVDANYSTQSEREEAATDLSFIFSMTDDKGKPVLNEREKTVLMAFTGNEFEASNVALIIGTGEERVRQINAAAMAKVRRALIARNMLSEDTIDAYEEHMAQEKASRKVRRSTTKVNAVTTPTAKPVFVSQLRATRGKEFLTELAA